MERSNIVKWLFFGLALFLFMQFGKPLLFGSSADQLQPLDVNDTTAAAERAPAATCTLDGDRFRAELSTRGGSLRHVWLTDPKYTRSVGDKEPIDLVTTSLESRMPLRTDLRLPGGSAPQVPYDDVDWKLDAQDGKSCTFTYADDAAKLTKVVAATGKPYELSVNLTVENLAAEPRNHRLTVEQTAWRTKKDTEGGTGRTSQWLTETVASTEQTKTERQHPDAFEPSKFKDKEFTTERWRRTPGDARFVAVSSSYFASIAIPLEGPARPAAETQIEEVWHSDVYAQKTKDPQFGHVYRARLAYPEKQLQPHEAATYKILSYTGPKERDLLAALDHGASDVLNLGWFSPIAKVLIGYLNTLYRFVGSWGWAICLLTITVRLLLFPLSLQQIKSSAAMRKLKPEMDAINEKYKDDATQKGLALQELWRKNKIANPVVGCFPMLLQMPVWFALYTALQTAVELYHTPFGPLIPDLAVADKYHIIPFVLGGSSFIQQRIMPPQGDPAQQKMMMYLMPGIFTAMMFFLPAGLGVYMLTNTWLGIGQQLLVERYLRSRPQESGDVEVEGNAKADPRITVKEKIQGDDDKSAPALGKGKARVRG